MAVRKRKYRSGHVAWSYVFEAPGSTREKRQQITESGFATKGAAIDAEAIRRVEEQKKHEIEQTLGDSVAPLPKSLGMLLDEFFVEYAEKKLAPKTVERYREQVAYLATELSAMPLTEITPLHLHREWSRLAESGGHYRRTKASRPLSKKTVRNIASMVSSAFTRAIKWGLVSMNPVTNSEPPVPKKSRGAAISVAQTDTLIEAASGPWCLPLIIEMAASLGAPPR